MSVTRTQITVAAGMTGGLLLTAGAFASPWLPVVPSGLPARIGVWCACSLLSAAWLVIAVGRLARHRFFTPADIDGGGIGGNTARATLLQTLIQNTLEQTVLAVVAYGAWLALGPPDRAGLVVVSAGYFAIGRLLFFAGYARGAPARALGFALTFYPSVALVAATLPAALARIAGLLNISVE